MKLLIHICCAPCLIYPLRVLREEGHDVTGLFYNPNIHPSLEYRKRLDTLIDYAGEERLPLIIDDEYRPEAFMRAVAFRESHRCAICYHLRLSRTARRARDGSYDGITSTLLSSTYQDHALIREVGTTCAIGAETVLYYRDFREGRQESIDRSRSLGMYRQPYCGCLYSEEERYRKRRGAPAASTDPWNEA